MRIYFIALILNQLWLSVDVNALVCGNITCSAYTNRCQGDRCLCVFGFKGLACDVDMDECKLAHSPLCGTTGHCENTMGGFRCGCLSGWNGDHCHHRNISEPLECLPGWTGDHCDTDINECLHSSLYCPGENNICINTPGQYECMCEHGWNGSYCTEDTDECLNDPCLNGATCDNNPGNYSCICDVGWTAENCSRDVDECLYNPCAHSATCINTSGSFTCVCRPGWTGRNCSWDVDECDNRPLNSNELCINTYGSFHVICQQGWQGRNCTVDVDECLTNPCGEFGSCINIGGSYVCNCSALWTGQWCDSPIQNTLPPHTANNLGLIVGVVIGALFLLWIILVVAVLTKYTLRKPRKIKDSEHERTVINIDHQVTKGDDVTNVYPSKPAMATYHASSSTGLHGADRQLQEIVMKTKFSVNKISA